MYPIYARIETLKTRHLQIVSVEAGVWLLLYATVGFTAARVSHTIDGSWFQVGWRRSIQNATHSVETGVDLCCNFFVPPFMLELTNQRQHTYTSSPSRQAFGYRCMPPPVEWLCMFRVPSMSHGLRGLELMNKSDTSLGLSM